MSGLKAQLGYANEGSGWGSAATPTKFVEMLSEGIKNNPTRYESKGLRAGRRTTFRWAPGVPMIGGPFLMELPNVNVATFLKHAFGNASTTGAGPYTTTFTPGSRLGYGLTFQVGRPDITDTVQPFTWSGSKIVDFELSSDVDDYAHLMLNVAAKTETTATALAVASYPAGYSPMTAISGGLTIGGSQIALRKFSLKGVVPAKTDRKGPGLATIREPLENAPMEFTIQISADFESLTQYQRFTGGTEAPVVLSFGNGTDTLTITTNARFDGDSPVVTGPDILEQPLNCKCVSSTSDAAAITAVLVNQDATA